MLPEIQFSGTYQDKDCPIAMLEYKPYNLGNYVDFSDYTKFIPENKARDYEKLTFIISGTIGIASGSPTNIYLYPVNDNLDHYLLNKDAFLVTDKVCPDIPDYPLFYQHRLQYDLYSDQKNPEKYIKVRKNGKSLLDEKTYVLEYGNVSLTQSGILDRQDVTWNRIKSTGNYARTRVLLPYDNDYMSYFDIEYDAFINSGVQRRVELINRSGLYNEGVHYNMTTSGVLLLPGDTNYPRPSGDIYLQKRYDSEIFFKPFDEVLTPSGESNWYLTMNPGKIVSMSGIINTGNIDYWMPNDTGTYIFMSGEHPQLYNQNVFKTTKFPLYVNTSGYPTYTLISGISFHVNEELLDNKYIQSIDVEKGFIQTKINFNTTDTISVDYKVNSRENFVLRNMDLNPKHFNQFNAVNDGISIAIVPTGWTGYAPTGIIYYRTLDNLDGDFTKITYGWSGGFASGTTTSGVIDPNAILLAEIVYKNIPTDIISISDCRRLGGGLKSNKDTKESEWYYDRGKWDGEILQSNSAIAIQIPSGVINYFIGKFYDNGSFTEENYNEEILQGADPSGTFDTLDFKNLKYYNAVKEAHKYITETIERYLPASTSYVIMDDTYKLINMLI